MVEDTCFGVGAVYIRILRVYPYLLSISRVVLIDIFQIYPCNFYVLPFLDFYCTLIHVFCLLPNIFEIMTLVLLSLIVYYVCFKFFVSSGSAHIPSACWPSTRQISTGTCSHITGTSNFVKFMYHLSSMQKGFWFSYSFL